MEEAIDLLQGLQSCSVSLLQRKLRIGYPRAARLMEVLEQQGIVGPEAGSQGRAVLLGRNDEEAGGSAPSLYVSETTQAHG